MKIRFLSLNYLLIIGLFIEGSNATASEQKQLSHIVAQIKDIKNALQEKNKQRDAWQKELKQLDVQYGEVSQNRSQTEQQIAQQRQKITQLENQVLTQQNKMHLQEHALAEQLRLYYLLQSRGGAIKLLLNQQDFNQINRMLYYYQVASSYRADVIHQLQSNLQQNYQRQQQLYGQYQTLQQLQQKQHQQEQHLTVLKLNRTQLINQINLSINDQTQQLEHLSANKKRLEETLRRLTQQKNAVLPANYSSLPFPSLYGRLPWPTQGTVMHYFNTPIEQSQLKWSGELIAAPDEQPVYAVADGTVVFAKWLEGYGLLLIINHGDGYMTLYGRNHSLYQREGVRVKAGDLIATVGQSGGFNKPALYFAIRHDAKPLDPNQWCMKP